MDIHVFVCFFKRPFFMMLFHQSVLFFATEISLSKVLDTIQVKSASFQMYFLRKIIINKLEINFYFCSFYSLVLKYIPYSFRAICSLHSVHYDLPSLGKQRSNCILFYVLRQIIQYNPLSSLFLWKFVGQQSEGQEVYTRRWLCNRQPNACLQIFFLPHAPKACEENSTKHASTTSGCIELISLHIHWRND